MKKYRNISQYVFPVSWHPYLCSLHTSHQSCWILLPEWQHSKECVACKILWNVMIKNWTDTQTDGWTDRCLTKKSLWAAMLHKQHKNTAKRNKRQGAVFGRFGRDIIDIFIFTTLSIRSPHRNIKTVARSRHEWKWRHRRNDVINARQTVITLMKMLILMQFLNLTREFQHLCTSQPI